MKKIGILTFYHNSCNFGGNLQAYALCALCNQNGYEAEQIAFIESKKTPERVSVLQKIKKIGIARFPFVLMKRILRNIAHRQPSLKREEKKHNVYARKKAAFEDFNKNAIPHSKQIYYRDTVYQCVGDYDVFISGSDQIWNTGLYITEYFLNFVPDEKKKIAYAPSITVNQLSDEKCEMLSKYLNRYHAVSVRESEAVDLLQPLCDKPVQFVLDPTFLLDRADWEKIAEKTVDFGDYIFCYFLGNNEKERKIAKEYAQSRGLKLATIGHAWKVMKEDKDFGDVRLYDTTPGQFIELIKNAEYVFTDSFHAVVFSKIFEKQYFVFNRDNKGSMGSRIRTITSLFETEDRFCFGERETLGYVESLTDIDYGKELPEFEKKKKESIDFLLGALKEEK